MHFLLQWQKLRERLGFSVNRVLTKRGGILMSVCFFIASFCGVAAGTKLAIPPTRPVELDVLPLWLLIAVGTVSFVSAIAIMTPVDDFIIHKETSIKTKAFKKKKKQPLPDR